MRRPCRSHTVLTTLALAVAAVAALSAAITFTSTFKSLDAGAVSFAGKKVAALVISNDDSLRVAGEESLVRELNARGMQAVATYRIAPKEELRSAETARPWFEKGHVEGVVAVRPVSADTRQTYTPAIWVSHELRHALGLLRLRVERRVRARLGAEGNDRRRRDHGLQRAAQPAPVGGGQRDEESARPARVRRGAGRRSRSRRCRSRDWPGASADDGRRRPARERG